jgi:hypothetical protein
MLSYTRNTWSFSSSLLARDEEGRSPGIRACMDRGQVGQGPDGGMVRGTEVRWGMIKSKMKSVTVR